MNQSVHSIKSRNNGDQNFGAVSDKSIHSQRQMEIIQKANIDKLAKTYEGHKDDYSYSTSDNKIDILSEEIVQLIKAYSNENSKLKEQKELIAKEMEKLEKISQLLLTENDQLEQHSNFRVLDLKKIAQSISLNLSQSEHDLRHRIHLYSEQNNSIIRSLGELQKESQGLDTSLFKSDKERKEIHRVITETEFKILESSARIKDLQNQIAALKAKKNNLTKQRTQKTEKIDEYFLDNADLRSYNINALKQLTNQRDQLGVQKPRIITQNVKLHSNIIELKTHQKSLKEQLSIKQKQIEILSNNIERQRNQNQQKQNSIHANNSLALTMNDRAKRIEKQIEQSQTRQKQQQMEYSQLTRKKEELTKNLNNADVDLKGKYKTWNDNLKQNRQAKIQNVSSLKNNISKKTLAFAHEKATLQYNVKEIKNQIDFIKEEITDKQDRLYEIKKNGETIGQFKREISKLQSQIAQQDRKLQQRRA